MRLPDGGPCTAASVECVGDVLRTCAGSGAMYQDTPCSWGCGSAGTPHCLQIVPTGGAVMAGDVGLGSDALDDITLPMNTVINTDDGSIKAGSATIRGAGSGVRGGIDFELRGTNVAMFRFKSLSITGETSVRGHRAAALVADGMISVGAVVDARGTCMGSGAGPGGYPGGAKNVAGFGSGGGRGGSDNKLGGGGGGFGGSGGSGGNPGDPTMPTPGGAPWGTPTIDVLEGGAGGGGGGGNGGVGGGGGGALQLVSNAQIVIGGSGVAGINAGGCGGQNGNAGNDGGGGGGAGGTIVLEAPSVQLVANSALAVNGGAGGNGAASSTSAAPAGSLSRTPAQNAPGGSPGGFGGAANMLDGTAGLTTGNHGGGGGGAVGRIRINTRSGSASVDAAAVLSPALDDEPTTCTQGAATLQ